MWNKIANGLLSVENFALLLLEIINDIDMWKIFVSTKKEANVTNRNQFFIFHSVYNLNKKDLHFFLKTIIISN